MGVVFERCAGLDVHKQPPHDAGAPSKAPAAVRELAAGVMNDAEARLMAAR
jgi:hypothetical protein